MKKSLTPLSPDAYVASLGGWQKRYAEALRATVVRRKSVSSSGSGAAGSCGTSSPA